MKIITKYGAVVNSESIKSNLQRITSQVYKLLPLREEGEEWRLPLVTIQEELCGMAEILSYKESLYLELISKLEGLFILDDFFCYRRTILECLTILNKIEEAFE